MSTAQFRKQWVGYMFDQTIALCLGAPLALQEKAHRRKTWLSFFFILPNPNHKGMHEAQFVKSVPMHNKIIS